MAYVAAVPGAVGTTGQATRRRWLSLATTLAVAAAACLTQFRSDSSAPLSEGKCSTTVDLIVVLGNGTEPSLSGNFSQSSATAVRLAVTRLSQRLPDFPQFSVRIGFGGIGPSIAGADHAAAVNVPRWHYVPLDPLIRVAATDSQSHEEPMLSAVVAMGRALVGLFHPGNLHHNSQTIEQPHRRILLLVESTSGSKENEDSDDDSTNDMLAAMAAQVQNMDFSHAPSSNNLAIVLTSTTTGRRIGAPECANDYASGGGFNIERTLRCLRDNGDDSTRDGLQAAFLEHGLEVQVHQLDSMLANDGHRLERTLLSAVTDPKGEKCSPFGTEMRKLTIASPEEPCTIHSFANRPVLHRQPSRPDSFVEDTVKRRIPVVFSGTVAANWSLGQLTGDIRAFLALLSRSNFSDVKQSREGQFMDASAAPFNSLIPPLNIYSVVNVSSVDTLEKMIRGDLLKERCQLFIEMPPHMREMTEPSRPLFATDEDHKLRKQYFWLSSPGVRTHTHFDQDHNFFVQLIGSKRFTLYPASDHLFLHTFPRLHPLWHKSQAGCPGALPGARRCVGVEPLVVEVHAGQVLYIPPYTYHSVETLEASISLSSLSHDNDVRRTMELVYSHDFKFDILVNQSGKVAALRLFLDLAIHGLYSRHPHAPSRYISGLLRERYSAELLDVLNDTADISVDSKSTSCDFSDLGIPQEKVPTAQHVYQDCMADAQLTTAAFASLPPPIRDILWTDFVEEIVEGVVGVHGLVSFFQGCFFMGDDDTTAQQYYLTDANVQLHSDLWRYYDEEIDGALD